jgi:hypothetical protein
LQNTHAETSLWWYVLQMIPRRSRFKVALLLALLLPLQGLSAAALCGPSNAASAAIDHHCAHVPGIAQHHGCGTCCAIGVAAAPLRWIAPRSSNPEVSSVTPLPPPKGQYDRLDRPPRL